MKYLYRVINHDSSLLLLKPHKTEKMIQPGFSKDSNTGALASDALNGAYSPLEKLLRHILIARQSLGRTVGFPENR